MSNRIRTKCAIPSCTAADREEEEAEVTFFRFPHGRLHHDMRERWLGVVRGLRGDPAWDPPLETFVCSRHFTTKQAHRKSLLGSPNPCLRLIKPPSPPPEVGKNWRKCIIPSCTMEDRSKETTLSFFTYPDALTQPKRWSRWTTLMRELTGEPEWTAPTGQRQSSICSRHFPSSAMSHPSNTQRRRIMGRAEEGEPVPSLNLHPKPPPPPPPPEVRASGASSDRKCIIPSCTRENRNNETVLSFFTFPDAKIHPRRWTRWTKLMRELRGEAGWTPSSSQTFICSRHFPTSAISHPSNTKRRNLMGNAEEGEPVPSLYLHPPAPPPPAVVEAAPPPRCFICGDVCPSSSPKMGVILFKDLLWQGSRGQRLRREMETPPELYDAFSSAWDTCGGCGAEVEEVVGLHHQIITLQWRLDKAVGWAREKVEAAYGLNSSCGAEEEESVIHIQTDLDLDLGVEEVEVKIEEMVGCEEGEEFILPDRDPLFPDEDEVKEVEQEEEEQQMPLHLLSRPHREYPSIQIHDHPYAKNAVKPCEPPPPAEPPSPTETEHPPSPSSPPPQLFRGSRTYSMAVPPPKKKRKRKKDGSSHTLTEEGVGQESQCG